MSYHHYDYDAHGGVLTNYSYYNNYGHISNNINSNNYNNYNNNYTSTDDITTAYTNANNKYCNNNNNNNSDTATSTNLYETNHRSNSIFGNSGKMQTQTQNQTTVPDASDRNTTGCCNICSAPPPVIFLFVTLLMTTSATAMLCAAIMTDHWEHVTWDRNILEKITNQSGQRLEWILNDRVALLPPKNPHRNNKNVFLVPMHGGIWTLCVDLTPREFIYLKHNKNLTNITQPCINYLAGSSVDNSRIDEQQQQRNDWQHSEFQTTLHPHLRMQNLSISCSLVCLIILGSAALVGTFGICHRQISAILITGVMYLLAALFALFTLMIIHFKRQQGRPMLDSDFDGTVDGLLSDKGAAKAAQNLLGARIFITSWSLDLGWGGVVLCSITSVLWILLSKIMRYNPISAFMI